MPGAETLKEPKASGPLRFQGPISVHPGTKVRRQAMAPNSRGLGLGENAVCVHGGHSEGSGVQDVCS